MPEANYYSSRSLIAFHTRYQFAESRREHNSIESVRRSDTDQADDLIGHGVCVHLRDGDAHFATGKPQRCRQEGAVTISPVQCRQRVFGECLGNTKRMQCEQAEYYKPRGKQECLQRCLNSGRERRERGAQLILGVAEPPLSPAILLVELRSQNRRPTIEFGNDLAG